MVWKGKARRPFDGNATVTGGIDKLVTIGIVRSRFILLREENKRTQVKTLGSGCDHLNSTYMWLQW